MSGDWCKALPAMKSPSRIIEMGSVSTSGELSVSVDDGAGTSRLTLAPPGAEPNGRRPLLRSISAEGSLPHGITQSVLVKPPVNRTFPTSAPASQHPHARGVAAALARTGTTDSATSLASVAGANDATRHHRTPSNSHPRLPSSPLLSPASPSSFTSLSTNSSPPTIPSPLQRRVSRPPNRSQSYPHPGSPGVNPESPSRANTGRFPFGGERDGSTLLISDPAPPSSTSAVSGKKSKPPPPPLPKRRKPPAVPTTGSAYASRSASDLQAGSGTGATMHTIASSSSSPLNPQAVRPRPGRALS